MALGGLLGDPNRGRGVDGAGAGGDAREVEFRVVRTALSPRSPVAMGARELRRARREERQHGAETRREQGRDSPVLRRWRMLRRRLGTWLVGWCAPLLLRLLACTWRVQRHGRAGGDILRAPGPWIIALWHGRMLVPMPLSEHKGRGIAILVSPSDDGTLVEMALSKFGYTVIRGSSSRGGARAMREMAGALRQGRPVVVTPDGPRGPRHAMNVGVAWLARETQAPILSCAIAVDRAWRLRSWDRFTIPKPFARIFIRYGDPVRVLADADELALEQVAGVLRQQLLDSERAGFLLLGVADDCGPA